MHFTSWDANTFLCLLSVFPEEVVRGMINLVKETHEDFVRKEALDYYCNLDIYKLYQEDKYYSSNPIKELKYKWIWRCPEIRRKVIARWTRSNYDWNCSHVWNKESLGKPLNAGKATCRAGYWNSGEAWSYTIKDRELDTSEWGEEEEKEYFDMKDMKRRGYATEWYENIHEGRYFLFFKENDIFSDNLYNNYKNEMKSICDMGCRAQVAQDLLIIDGPGIGELSGNHIEHIDDIFC